MIVQFLMSQGKTLDGVASAESCVFADVIQLKGIKKVRFVMKGGKQLTVDEEDFQQLYKCFVVGDECYKYCLIDNPFIKEDILCKDDYINVPTFEDIKIFQDETAKTYSDLEELELEEMIKAEEQSKEMEDEK